MNLRYTPILAVLALAATSSLQAGVVYTRTEAPGLAISDFDTTESVLTISDSLVIDSITIRIHSILHDSVGDLKITLVAPNSSSSLVFDQHGGGNENITGMYLDDRVLYAIANADAPFTGYFAPDNPMNFTGLNAQGDWKLQVYDNSGGDAGQVVSWSLAINEPIPEPSTMAMLAIAAGGLAAMRFRRS